MIIKLLTGDVIESRYIRIVSQMCLQTRQDPEQRPDQELALQYWHYFEITLADVDNPIHIGTHSQGLYRSAWRETGFSADQVQKHRALVIETWRLSP
jgi:hypothetical protein